MNSKTIKAAKWHKKCLVEILSKEFDMAEIDIALNNCIHKANDDRRAKANTDEYSRGYIDAMRCVRNRDKNRLIKTLKVLNRKVYMV